MEVAEKLTAEQVKEKLKEFVSNNLGLGSPIASHNNVFIRSKEGEKGDHYRQSDALSAYVGHESKQLRKQVLLNQKDTRIDLDENSLNVLPNVLRRESVKKAGYSWDQSEFHDMYDWLMQVVKLHSDFYIKYMKMPMVAPFFYTEHRVRHQHNNIYVDFTISMGFDDFVSRVTIKDTPVFSNIHLNVSQRQLESIHLAATSLAGIMPTPLILGLYNSSSYPRTKHDYASVLLQSMCRNQEITTVKDAFEKYTRLMYLMRHDLKISDAEKLPEVVDFDSLDEIDRDYISTLTSVVVSHFQLVVELNKKHQMSK